MHIMPDEFKALEEKYNEKFRETVVEFLFDYNGWKYCNMTLTWRKVVKADDDEFPNDEDKVIFLRPPHKGSEAFVNWWYRIYKMAKEYIEEREVFYHEPIKSMPERGMVSLLIACEVYHNKLQQKLYQNEEFKSY